MFKKNDYPQQITHQSFLENLYNDYLKHPEQIDSSWKHLFEEMDETLASASSEEDWKEAYRRYGHLAAHFNPLNPRPSLPSGWKKDSFFQSIYCDSVGFEYKGVEGEVETWLQEEIEHSFFQRPFSSAEKKEILSYLMRAEFLENFLHVKHVGKKRFSLEGGESLIPMLSFMIQEAGEKGIEEVVFGMSHRGRLNVLVNILKKPLQELFKEFNEHFSFTPDQRMGDVKYHKGYVNPHFLTGKGKTVSLSLASNPSHLESICPVVEGMTKSKEIAKKEASLGEKTLPVLLHGDAALSGQGVVYETLQLSRLNGYSTGGTVHLVVNNQVGFTTSPEEGRSTRYCTDIAKAFECPVFHVSGEDPENSVRVILLALKTRNRFKIDVFVDLNCFRKYGHNEGDEPFFTQPKQYSLIRHKMSVRQIYQEALMQQGIVTNEEVEALERSIKEELQSIYSSTDSLPIKTARLPTEFPNSIKTAVNKKQLETIAEKIYDLPSDWNVHPKVKSLFQDRLLAVKENKPLDWGSAECLAYGILVSEGLPVRISGQDCGRGTFSHRHATVADQTTGAVHCPLRHVSEGQGTFDILNSCLSEMAVLGFEYGYSLVQKKGLTIWEAQFGDFANSAQVIIDQYITSGEEKWGQYAGIVLLLPHGYEGQGPEHSSARLERYLSLAGHDNMFIVNPSTPSQLFHLLRAQAKMEVKKPLIVITPKEHLRHPACSSSVSDLTEGKFFPILDDPKQMKRAKKLLFCSGKIYYDLEKHRSERDLNEVVIVRIEQLYPLDVQEIEKILHFYTNVTHYAWVQEEPENMGAWPYISPLLRPLLPKEALLQYVGRKQSATPATGFHSRHKEEHQNIIQQVFEK